MKNLKTLLALLAVNVAFAGTPVETLIPVDHIYVPKGFDSNDNSEVILSGHLPNLCHKAPKTTVTQEGNKVLIEVTALKYHPTNPFCAEVLVPFVEPVSLGVLDKGVYDIVVNGKSIFRKESSIFITESTSPAIDDNVYANVDHVETDPGSRTVKLAGYNPSDCLEFQEVKVASNDKDTYAILPIMKKVSDFCPMKMTPFKYEVEVPSELKKEAVLLHVRAMDGKSVNTLFYQDSFEE